MPSYDEMMQPTLDALHRLGGGATSEQILQEVVAQLALPEEIVAQPHKVGKRQTEVEYRLQWTRTYLRKYGLIDRSGIADWSLTEQGKQFERLEPMVVVKAVRAQLDGERKAKKSITASATTDSEAAELATGDVKLDEVVSGDVHTDTIISPTPLFPTYTEVHFFLRVLDGVPYAHYRSMNNQIGAQSGSPQEQVDWANPNEWIAKRLSGVEQDLAYRLYRESQGKLNPRHSRGCWFFVSKHNLIGRDSSDRLVITEQGKTFLEKPGGEFVASIDKFEGVFVILRLVAEKSPAKHGDLLGEYSEYSRNYTTFHSDSVLKSSLYSRLRNLVDRGLVISRSLRYEITDLGLGYLQQNAQLPENRKIAAEQPSDIHRLAKELRDEGRKQLFAYLQEMDPYRFEHVVKQLLIEMGYTNVETTAPSNDKGIDVVANIELGISSVREVIQVKRHKGTINRPILDQLRGSLYRFNAVRGTIITTGSFSKGALEVAFERGVAPITLIDGEKLLQLLILNEIGIRKYQVDYYEFAPDRIDPLGASEIEPKIEELERP